jgi:thioredoxin reductase (NADPH)
MAIICLSSLSADKIDLKANPRIYSAVVIGSGPGALTSAIYLQRAGIETLVIEGSTPGGAITQSPGVHNWPGEIEISGEKLIKKIRLQAEHNGTTFVSREVTYIDLSKRPYTVTMRSVYDYEDVVKVQANAVIVATGSNPKLLGIPGESGEQGYWTRGVYNCAVCDGGLYKGKTVAVIGGGDSAIIEADYLSKIAKKVYVILRSEQFRTVETLRKNELVKKDNVEVINNTNISEISGDGKKVTHLNLSNEKALPVDGVFVAIGATPNTKILNHQLELDHRGYVCLVDGQQTSVPGVFAVGDIVDPIYKQAVSAAGDGAKAALQAEHYLASIKNESLEMQPQPKIFQVINPGNGDSASDLISEKAFYDAISEGQTPLVVDFYSPYCNPCKTFGQSFQEAAQKHHGKARFLKVDVTQFPQLAQNYGVYSLPTLMVFDINGKQVEKASGLAGVKKSINKLDRFTK